jgi:hypothetical protein
MTSSRPGLSKGWVTSDEAAEMAGLSASGFRREVSRDEELKAARQMLGPLACYPESVIRWWAAGRPGKGRRKPVI